MFKLKSLLSARTPQAAGTHASPTGAAKPVLAQSPSPQAPEGLPVPVGRAARAGVFSAPRVGLDRLMLARPKKPTLKAGPDSTLADLPAPDPRARNNTLAARPLGNGGVELRWSHKRSVPLEETQLAQQEMARLERNSAVKPKPLSAGVARVPTECVATWLDRLDQVEAGIAAADPRAKVIGQLKASARMAWMKHDLGVEATRSSLLAASKKCDSAGMGYLALVARTLAAELASHGPDGPPLTRLHDNLNGRVWETALFAELVRNTPQPVMQATQQLCNHLAGLIDRVPPEGLHLLHERLLEYIGPTDIPRPWLHERQDVVLYLQRLAAQDTDLTYLKILLQSPPRHGMDCVAQMWLAQRATLGLNSSGNGGEWANLAYQNYADHVHPAKSISGVPMGNTTIGSGITTKHQPPAIRLAGSPPAERPAVINKPELEALSPAARTQLNQGSPLCGGMSGTTNLMWHVMRHAELDEGKRFDVQNAMLGIFMMVNQDGGHSLHECLWVVDQIGGRGGSPPAFGSGTPDEYVCDFDAYFKSFTDPDVTAALQNSCEAAWTALGEYRKQHLPSRP